MLGFLAVMIKKLRLKHAFVGAASGGVTGFILGIAGFGGAVSGLVSLGLMGAYLGWNYIQFVDTISRGRPEAPNKIQSEDTQITSDELHHADEPRFKHALVGAASGSVIGFNIGSAGFGGAVSGLMSLGILGAYLGWNFTQLSNMTSTGKSQTLNIIKPETSDIIEVETSQITLDEANPIEESELIANLKTRVLRTISLQLHLMGKEPPNSPYDDFSIGYVFGVVDACIQHEGFASDSVEATGAAIMVFFEIYGSDFWKILLGQVLDEQGNTQSQVFHGASTGARDYLTFVNSMYPGDYGPMGWVTHERAST